MWHVANMTCMRPMANASFHIPAHRTAGADFQHPSAGITHLRPEPPFRDALARGQMQMRPPRVGKPAHGFRMIGGEARRIRDRAAELFNPVPSRLAPC
jgi:hypothetical protein